MSLQHVDLYINYLSFLSKNDIILLRNVSKFFKEIVKIYSIYYLKQSQIHTRDCIIHDNIKNPDNILNNECIRCITGFAIILCYENTTPIIFINKIKDNELILINYVNALLDLDKTDYLKIIYDIKKINFCKINKNRGCFLSDKSFQFILKYISTENNGKIYNIKSFNITSEFINNIFDNINVSLDAISYRFNLIDKKHNDITKILTKYSDEIIDTKHDFIKCIDRTYILFNFLK